MSIIYKFIAVILIFGISPLYAYSQKERKKILFDINNMPEWQNFERKPPRNSIHAAETASGIEMKYEINNNKLTVFLAPYFYPDGSWVKPDAKKPSLYTHEMLHFTITALFARKLRKKISALAGQQVKIIIKQINTLFSENRKAEHALQLLYDKGTRGGLDATEQKKWQIKIMKQLKALILFSKKSLEIKVGN